MVYNRFQKLSRQLRKTVLFRQYKLLPCAEVQDNFIIYIYKDFRLQTYDLRSNESRDHCREDGYLMPSTWCGFCFEADFQH